MRPDPLLVVSRDTRLQDTLVGGLRRLRVAAVSADDARGALDLLQLQPLRCVIVDVERAADWPACQQIAAAALVAGIPVIVISAWVAPDGRYRARAFDCGCAAFVLKPCRADALLRTVERLEAGEHHIEVIGTS